MVFAGSVGSSAAGRQQPPDIDAKAFVERARSEKVPAAMLVTKGRDHMGVVKALLEDKSDVLEKVREFMAKPKP